MHRILSLSCHVYHITWSCVCAHDVSCHKWYQYAQHPNASSAAITDDIPKFINIAIYRGSNVGRDLQHTGPTLLMGEKEGRREDIYPLAQISIHQAVTAGQPSGLRRDSNEKSAGLVAADMRGKLLGLCRLPVTATVTAPRGSPATL